MSRRISIKHQKNFIILPFCLILILLFSGCSNKTGNDNQSQHVNYVSISESPITVTENIEAEQESCQIEYIDYQYLALTEKLQPALDAIDCIIQSDIENGFTSAQIAIIKDGKMVYQNAWGLVNSYNADGERLTEGTCVDNNTLYDLASNTKMYSIVYASQLLVSQKKLDLNQKIVDIIGDEFAEETYDITYKRGQKISLETQKEWKRSITVKDVLCHQAGFPSSIHYYDPNYSMQNLKHEAGAINPLYLSDNSERNNTLTLICQTPLLYEPGGEPVYSDIDYMLMTFVIEKLVSMPLDEFLNEYFWQPMGLTNISYRPTENGFSPNNIAATELHGNTRDGALKIEGFRDYTLQGEVHDEASYYCMNGISGHAGLFSNATDLAKLCSLMIDGSYEGRTYFNEDVICDFSASISEEYPGWGIGWWRHGEGGERESFFSSQSSFNTIGHQGWTGTLTMIDRENDLILVLLTNRINTPINDPEHFPDQFNGKWYTSSKLGFAPAMIYSALLNEDSDNTKEAILEVFDNYIAQAEENAKYMDSAVDNNYASLAVISLNEAKEKWSILYY